MHKTQKMTAIPYFHNKGDKEKSTKHNSAIEANTSSEEGTSSEVKTSLSFQRWNATIITRGVVLKCSTFLFVLFPADFLLLLEVRAFEADQFSGLNFSLTEVRPGSSSSCHRCLSSPSSSVCSVMSSVQVITVELLVWPTGSWHVRAQDTKNVDLQNGTPPNGLSSLSPLWLHFQSFWII